MLLKGDAASSISCQTIGFYGDCFRGQFGLTGSNGSIGCSYFNAYFDIFGYFIVRISIYGFCLLICKLNVK